MLPFGHEIRWCFAVADASQSYKTLSLFLVFFCYVLGTKLSAVLPLRVPHKAMQLVLARLAGYKTEKSQFFYSRVSEVTLGLFLVFFCYFLGKKLGSVLPLQMRHKAMQLVLGRLAGHKTEKSSLL